MIFRFGFSFLCIFAPFFCDIICRRHENMKRYARLAARNVRNFKADYYARECNSSCASVGWLLPLHNKVFSRPLAEEVVYQCHASFVEIVLGVLEGQKRLRPEYVFFRDCKMKKIFGFLVIITIAMAACNTNAKQNNEVTKAPLVSNETKKNVYETNGVELVENKDFKILLIDRRKLVDNYFVQILQDDLSEDNVSNFAKTIYNQYYKGKNLTVTVFDYEFSKDFIERYLISVNNDCIGEDYVALADHMVYWLCFGNECGDYYLMQDDYSLYTSYGGKNWKKEK